MILKRKETANNEVSPGRFSHLGRQSTAQA